MTEPLDRINILAEFKRAIPTTISKIFLHDTLFTSISNLLQTKINLFNGDAYISKGEQIYADTIDVYAGKLDKINAYGIIVKSKHIDQSKTEYFPLPNPLNGEGSMESIASQFGVSCLHSNGNGIKNFYCSIERKYGCDKCVDSHNLINKGDIMKWSSENHKIKCSKSLNSKIGVVISQLKENKDKLIAFINSNYKDAIENLSKLSKNEKYKCVDQKELDSEIEARGIHYKGDILDVNNTENNSITQDFNEESEKLAKYERNLQGSSDGLCSGITNMLTYEK